MAKQTINIGSAPNDGTGTPLRTAFDYCNLNFTELYTAVGPSGNNIVCPGAATITGALGAAGLNVTGATIPANGMYLGSANNLSFSYASTLGMTLNSTGLGVGASPSYQLHVAKAQSSQTAIYVDNQQNNAAASSALTLSAYGGSWNLSVPQSATFVNPLIFKFGSTEMMRLDASGNVGIGVTPSAWYTSFGTKAFQFAASGALCGLDVSSSDRRVGLLNNDFINTSGNDTYINTGHATKYQQAAGVHSWFTAASGTAGNAITFTQAMTLAASGALLIGQTTAGLDAQGGFWLREASSAFGSSIIINHRTAVGTGNSYAEFTHNGIGIGSITQNGTTGVLYNISSDYRLKESVAPLSGGLARVSALKPSIYKWKSDGSSGEGFLAHELAEVVPAAVTGEKDAVNEDGSIKSQGIDMSRVVPILVAAIQELTARVQTLETR